jgi:hypothetical protein
MTSCIKLACTWIPVDPDSHKICAVSQGTRACIQWLSATSAEIKKAFMAYLLLLAYFNDLGKYYVLEQMSELSYIT